MTIGIVASTRNNQLDQITLALDAGAGGALFRIYDGVRPATGGAVTTLLAELTMSVTSFPAAAAGTMTANAIADDTSANATGTATWFRMVDSDLNFVMDGDVATSGADLNVNTDAIVAGINVAVSSMVITAGNA
jgi:hypothetical protein